MFHKVKLPQTAEEFDKLVAKFTRYSDEETIIAILAQIIRYAAKDQMYVTRKHIIHSIQKVAANEVSDQKLAALQMSVLLRKYKEDPGDAQVVKALQNLADKGNQEAKDALAGPVLTVVDG